MPLLIENGLGGALPGTPATFRWFHLHSLCGATLFGSHQRHLLPSSGKGASDSCLMLDYMRVINFRYIIIIFYTLDIEDPEGFGNRKIRN